MRILKWSILGIVVLIIVVAIALYLNLNRIVRTVVQDQTAKSLDLSTQVGSASVSLFGGSVGLNNIAIGQPKGFSGDMFTLGGVRADVNYGQLNDDPVHVKGITIDAPVLLIEQQGGKLNIKQAMDQLPADTGKKQPPSGERQQSQPLRLIIDKLTISNAQVKIRPGDIGGLSLGKEYNISVPALSLENVGSGEGNQNGAAIKEVVMLVVSRLASEAANSDQVPDALKQVLNTNISDIAGQLQSKFNTELSKVSADLAKKLPGNLGQAVQGAITNPSSATQAVQQGLQQELQKNLPKNLPQGLGGLIPGAQQQPATRPAGR